MAKKKRIGYLGPECSFSHIAVEKTFGNKLTAVPMKNFSEIIAGVNNGNIDLGIVPFWNPYEEHIRQTQASIFRSKVIVSRVIKLKVDLYLCASEPTPLIKVKSIRSIKHVFKQCNKWIAEKLPSAKIQYSTSTAKAAEEIRNKKTIAAICSKEVAEKKKLHCIASKIQNINNNTLFFVIEKDDLDLTDVCGKYCLMAFKIKDEDEIKKTILDAFEKRRFLPSHTFDIPNTSKTSSMFFLEFRSGFHDLNFVAARTELENAGIKPRRIGSYSKNIRQVWGRY